MYDELKIYICELPFGDSRCDTLEKNLLLVRQLQTAAYGHFGRDEPELKWEDVSLAGDLRAAAGAMATAPGESA